MIGRANVVMSHCCRMIGQVNVFVSILSYDWSSECFCLKMIGQVDVLSQYCNMIGLVNGVLVI